jgi:hypothetical protein
MLYCVSGLKPNVTIFLMAVADLVRITFIRNYVRPPPCRERSSACLPFFPYLPLRDTLELRSGSLLIQDKESYIHMHTYIHIHTHTDTHTHTHTHTATRTHAHVYTHTHSHTHRSPLRVRRITSLASASTLLCRALFCLSCLRYVRKSKC